MRIVPVIRMVTFTVLVLGPAISVLAEEAPVVVNPETLHFSTPAGMPPCM